MGLRVALALSAGFVGYIIGYIIKYFVFSPWFFAALMKHPGLIVLTRSEGADDVSVDPWGVGLAATLIVAVVAAGLFSKTRANRALVWGALLVGFVGADLFWTPGFLTYGAIGFWSADLYAFAAVTGVMLRVTSAKRTPSDGV